MRTPDLFEKAQRSFVCSQRSNAVALLGLGERLVDIRNLQLRVENPRYTFTFVHSLIRSVTNIVGRAARRRMQVPIPDASKRPENALRNK